MNLRTQLQFGGGLGRVGGTHYWRVEAPCKKEEKMGKLTAQMDGSEGRNPKEGYSSMK